MEVNCAGDAFLIWYRYNQVGAVFSDVYLQICNKPKGGSFTNIESIESDPGCVDPSKLKAKILSDDDGDIAAVWLNSNKNGTSYNLMSAIQPNNWSWTSNALVVESIYTFSFDSVLLRHGQGDLLVAYPFYEKTAKEIHLYQSKSDIDYFVPNLWGSMILLSDSSSNGFPSIAGHRINEQSVVGITWEKYDGANVVIDFVDFVKNEVLPPTNVGVTQSSKDWKIFTEYYNTISWQTSPSSNIAGYAIYRDGVFVAEVDSTVFEYIDHNQEQNGSVTYGVSAFTDHCIQSDPATASIPTTATFWWW